MFNDYLERWSLKPDGKPIITATSKLLPVRVIGLPAILKIAVLDEEKRSGLLMIWWEGWGAARALAHGGDALLMERAQGGISLADLTHNGRDDEASRIICAVLDQLHAPRNRPLNFGSRGWLAIDPKGLIGERYFDYANILCNPDEEDGDRTGPIDAASKRHRRGGAFGP